MTKKYFNSFKTNPIRFGEPFYLPFEMPLREHLEQQRINTHVDAVGTGIGVIDAFAKGGSWPVGAAITIGTGAASIYYNYGK